MTWFTEWWNSIDWSASYWGAVGGLSAAITGVVAIWALIHAARDSRERSRPVVVAEYRVPENAHKRLEFVVRNAGASVARDIEVKFDPPLEPVQPGQAIRPFLVKRYSERITNLGPGQELTNSIHADLEDPGESDLPLDVTVKVSYRRSWLRRYKDSYRLVTGVYAQHTYATSTDSILGRLTQIKDELRKISGTSSGTNAMSAIRKELQAIKERLPSDSPSED
ncbi:hypothetical protein [Oerskovia enterophila]|uniref:Uncharacterized protein n=1 Tax=Oerskovia enterophila TaxID=43678 RepID=A0A163QU27_9CELL|nr:hypothetical protein [Oerskovia enterophila]KZM34531.1 hypothetical protein OJAG_28300 [Oerskovia enterophila]